eukprot:3505655-Pleurochrysis_carterae.AAC.1
MTAKLEINEARTSMTAKLESRTHLREGQIREQRAALRQDDSTAARRKAGCGHTRTQRCATIVGKAQESGEAQESGWARADG